MNYETSFFFFRKSEAKIASYLPWSFTSEFLQIGKITFIFV